MQRIDKKPQCNFMAIFAAKIFDLTNILYFKASILISFHHWYLLK